MTRQHEQTIIGCFIQWNKDGTVRDWHFTSHTTGDEEKFKKAQVEDAIYQMLMKFGYGGKP